MAYTHPEAKSWSTAPQVDLDSVSTACNIPSVEGRIKKGKILCDPVPSQKIISRENSDGYLKTFEECPDVHLQIGAESWSTAPQVDHDKASIVRVPFFIEKKVDTVFPSGSFLSLKAQRRRS